MLLHTMVNSESNICIYNIVFCMIYFMLQSFVFTKKKNCISFNEYSIFPKSSLVLILKNISHNIFKLNDHIERDILQVSLPLMLLM